MSQSFFDFFPSQNMTFITPIFYFIDISALWSLCNAFESNTIYTFFDIMEFQSV